LALPDTNARAVSPCACSPTNRTCDSS
jgi:hypothetical protein